MHIGCLVLAKVCKLTDKGAEMRNRRCIPWSHSHSNITHLGEHSTYAFDAILELTGVEIGLVYYQHMYEMVEQGSRGGMPQTSWHKIESVFLWVAKPE